MEKTIVWMEATKAQIVKPITLVHVIFVQRMQNALIFQKDRNVFARPVINLMKKLRNVRYVLKSFVGFRGLQLLVVLLSFVVFRILTNVNLMEFVLKAVSIQKGRTTVSVHRNSN